METENGSQHACNTIMETENGRQQLIPFIEKEKSSQEFTKTRRRRKKKTRKQINNSRAEEKHSFSVICGGELFMSV